MIETWDKPDAPRCPQRHPEGKPWGELWAVVDRRTSANAISREHDTPVWFCPDHGPQYIRQVAP